MNIITLGLCIVWGFVQAAIALAIPPLYAKITRTYGIINLGPGVLISVILGTIVALATNPWFLIGVALGVWPCYRILLGIFANKPE